ncbi:FIG01182371: hypothetical protein [hydrothermal vent metagenome]|uniref:Uncharacterized protein n=1 Tax=hydrothermal vent metagenome TaxID=652676 RepID=A0A3B0ZEN6_9ZZZZ
MNKPRTYVGIDKEMSGGMTTIGKIIRDAWVFGLIPESETCEGWDIGRFDVLLQKINAEWDKYGCSVSHLPTDLRERHTRIHGEAFKSAKAAGWSGECETDDENQTESPD